MAKAKSPAGSKTTRSRTKKVQNDVTPVANADVKTVAPENGAGEFASQAEMVSKDEVRREAQSEPESKPVIESTRVPQSTNLPQSTNVQSTSVQSTSVQSKAAAESKAAPAPKTQSESNVIPAAAMPQPTSSSETKNAIHAKGNGHAELPARAETAPSAETPHRTDGAFHGEIKPEARKLELMKSESRKNLFPINLDDEIRRRAYELYQQRGMGNGNEAEDWFNAEREIRQRYRQQSA